MSSRFLHVDPHEQHGVLETLNLGSSIDTRAVRAASTNNLALRLILVVFSMT